MPPSQLTFSPTVALSHSTHAPAPCALPALRPRLTRCFSAMPFLKKMQAGPMGNCMGRGAGQSSRALMSRRLPLLPSVVRSPYRFCHFFASSSCLSWPLPRSQCHTAATAGSEISPGVGEGSESFLPPHLA